MKSAHSWSEMGRNYHDFSDFEERLYPQLRDEEYGYINPDPDDEDYGRDSKFVTGFLEYFIAVREPGVEPTSAAVGISAGAVWTNTSNYILVEFPREGAPEFESLDHVKALFRLVVEYCQPEEGHVLSNKWRRKVAIYTRDNYLVVPPVGWLTWVADKRAVEVLPPWVSYEEVGEGLIVWFSERPVHSTDEEAVEKARALRDRLHENGYLPGDPRVDPMAPRTAGT